MKLAGGHVVVIGRSSGVGLAAARLVQDEGAEITITGCSQEKLIQAQQELGQVHTVVMDVADEGAEDTIVAVLSRIDHGPISAGTMLNSAIVNHGSSGPVLIPIVSSPARVYTARRQSDVRRYGGHGQT